MRWSHRTLESLRPCQGWTSLTRLRDIRCTLGSPVLRELTLVGEAPFVQGEDGVLLFYLRLTQLQLVLPRESQTAGIALKLHHWAERAPKCRWSAPLNMPPELMSILTGMSQSLHRLSRDNSTSHRTIEEQGDIPRLPGFIFEGSTGEWEEPVKRDWLDRHDLAGGLDADSCRMGRASCRARQERYVTVKCFVLYYTHLRTHCEPTDLSILGRVRVI